MKKIIKNLICCFLLSNAFVPLWASNEKMPQNVIENLIKKSQRPKIVVNKPKTNDELFEEKIADLNNGFLYGVKAAFESFSKSGFKNSKEYDDLCRQMLFHQIGLNISNCIDLDRFNALMANRSEKRDKQKTAVVNEAVNYFKSKGLTDPKEICSASVEYFQKLGEQEYNKGNYQLANTCFSSALEGENESIQLKECKKKIMGSRNPFRRGSIIFFGKFEPDGNKENGSEPIEWIILNNTGDKLVLISKYVLTHRVVHSLEKKFEWADSDLCVWLNNDFYNSAFDEREKKRMRRVGDNVFFLDNYAGDYVVIPCFDDLKNLDYYWLKTYAVPSDDKARELIDFEYNSLDSLDLDEGEKTLEEKVRDYEFKKHDKQPLVYSSNKGLSKGSKSVYWPTGYWVNHRAGNMVKRDSDFNRIYYRYFDENGFTYSAAAKFINGVRPVIAIDCPKELHIEELR